MKLVLADSKMVELVWNQCFHSFITENVVVVNIKVYPISTLTFIITLHDIYYIFYNNYYYSKSSVTTVS